MSWGGSLQERSLSTTKAMQCHDFFVCSLHRDIRTPRLWRPGKVTATWNHIPISPGFHSRTPCHSPKLLWQICFSSATLLLNILPVALLTIQPWLILFRWTWAPLPFYHAGSSMKGWGNSWCAPSSDVFSFKCLTQLRGDQASPEWFALEQAPELFLSLEWQKCWYMVTWCLQCVECERGRDES